MSDNNDMREAKDLAWKAFCEAPTSRDLGRSKVDAAVAAALEWQSQKAQVEPFAYCHLDVNGKAKELCSAPCADDDPRDTRTVQALYKHPSAPSEVPDGWKLVPTEPTPDMTLHGALSGVSHAGGKFSQKGAEEVYKAMLAASPQPAENDNQ